MTPAIEGQEPGPAALARPGDRVDAPATAVQAPALSISLEALVWLTIIGLAAALRLASLDHLPLTVDEGGRALAAWHTSQGNTPADWPGDLTSSLNAYVFSIFGSSDYLARLVPALAGSALIALLWPLSRYVGASALIAAGFLAFSPLLIHASRSDLPYATGGFLSIAMVLAVFGFLRSRRSSYLLVLAVGAGLALGSDPISTSTVIILAAFLAYEAAWRGNQEVLDALRSIQRNPSLLIAGLFFFLGALELAITHFGTSIDRLALPGLRQWVDMFELPRDNLPWHFHPGILVSYEAPALLLGGYAFLWLLDRRLAPQEKGISLFQRFLLFWAGGAAIVIAVTTRREAGQLILLLLPLALLAGCWIEDILTRADMSASLRAVPFLAPVLLLVTTIAVILSRWVDAGGVGSGGEKAAVLFSVGGALALIWAAGSMFGRHAAAGMLALALILSAGFLVHGATSVASGDGAEFLTDQRLDEQVFQLQKRLDSLQEEPSGPVVVDASLLPALGWYLRDAAGIAFVLSPPEDAAAILRPSGAAVPPGYRLAGAWPLAQGWRPTSIDPLDWWRWLVYREPWGSLSSIQGELLVRVQ